MQQGHDVALQIPSRDSVIGLQAVETGEVIVIGIADRLHDLPGLPVGHPDVSHKALADQIIEGAHRLFDRRDRVIRVDLIEVDIVQLQAFQAALNAVENVNAAGADVVWPRPHGAENLGGDDNIRALHVQRFQRFAQQDLRHPF